MVRIVDLDSLNPSDITDSNYLIVANTNSAYRTSRLSFANALTYFITTNAVSAGTVQSMIEAYVSDDTVTVANTDNFVTLSASPSFTLNQTGNKTITLGHKTKEGTASSTSNTNYHAVKNISIDNAAHITQIISEDQSLLFIPRSEFDFHINGDAALIVDSTHDTFTDANRTINISHKLKPGSLNTITAQNNYFVNSISFDSFGHVSAVTSTDVQALVNDSYVTQLITNSLTSDSGLIDDAIRALVDSSYLARITDSSFAHLISDAGSTAGLDLVDQAQISPLFSSEIVKIVAKVADSDFVMDRHYMGDPNLVNIFPSPGRYVNQMLFDDYGHVVEVGDVSVEDHITTAYIMAHHNPGESLDILGDSVSSGAGGYVVNRLIFDSGNKGHVIDAGKINLDGRYLKDVIFTGDRDISVNLSSPSFSYDATVDPTHKHLYIKHRPASQDSYSITQSLGSGTYYTGLVKDSAGHVISMSYVNGNLDARIRYIADSAWITLNHDQIHLADSNKVGLQAGEYVNSISYNRAGHITNTNVLRLDQYIDSAYIRVRTNDLYLDSAEAVGIIYNMVDSAYVMQRVVPAVDSAAVMQIIDSDYINARVNATLDSDLVIQLIDSAYVASRIGPVGIDSAAVAAIVDSALSLFTLDSNVTVHSNLYVDSDIIAAGNITAFGSFSDETLKENVVKIDNALDRIDLLTGYTFNYIAKPDVRMTGVMAGDAEKALSELVYTTSSGHKAVHYGNALGLLAEGIKELRKEVEEIKKKLN